MAKDESVGVRELARQIGCSHVLLLRLIKEGRMPQNEDGTIPLNAGLAAFENRKNTKKKKVETNKKKSTKKSKDKFLPEDPDEDEDELDNTGPTSDKLVSVRDVTAKFNKARLLEKTYQAKLKEIDYKLKTDILVEREAVEADASATATEIRERLTSIPVRVSAMCEMKTAREIEDILTDAIQDALSSFSKSKFIKEEL